MTVLPNNRFLKSTTDCLHQLSWWVLLILRFNRIVSGDCTAHRDQINDHKKMHQKCLKKKDEKVLLRRSLFS